MQAELEEREGYREEEHRDDSVPVPSHREFITTLFSAVKQYIDILNLT